MSDGQHARGAEDFVGAGVGRAGRLSEPFLPVAQRFDEERELSFKSRIRRSVFSDGVKGEDVPGGVKGNHGAAGFIAEHDAAGHRGTGGDAHRQVRRARGHSRPGRRHECSEE